MQNIQENNLKEISVSILGCGWLGLPLAVSFVQKKWNVLGSTTSKEKIEKLKEKGIKAFLIDLDNDIFQSQFFKTDYMIVCFPPRLKKNGDSSFLEQIEKVCSQLSVNKNIKVIFTSSTSVYPTENRSMKETDADSSHALYKAEQMLAKSVNERLTVLRLSGLMGYGRIPCKYFSGKKKLTNGETPVNYVFRDDVINVIEAVIEADLFNQTLNVTAAKHPNRKEVLENCSERTEYIKPEFIQPDQVVPFKIIDGEKLNGLLNYKFKYPNPINFPY
ncbi:SDR family NAD(P)-dependent oxidoreductase [Arcticibacterium luteifluviistationis]|uniref:NAD(P)-dependent oxidoreductase n=1 Tax=Arcticibacterium luteifluviistationis TaxID=1784714 RepID=A0A2Z4GDR4_9BACT|nr:SDR family NAD(P)-dependent oxidoreductase [Arcticibacterium luteifluviistationis]AWV99482.1 NAD(P)-dependent oxidoreductase [Arcticibacterium luteifluviistationis]